MDDIEIRDRISEQVSQIRAMARAIYFARTTSDFDVDDLIDRLDYVEDELQRIADRIWDAVCELPSPADWRRETEPED